MGWLCCFSLKHRGLNFWPSFRQALQKIVSRLINRSPPRKSLVKGERFMHIEGKPE